MYEESKKKSVFSYIKDGKLYSDEIDWQTEFKLEINAIRDFLFSKIDEDKKSPVYLDEKFREFVNDILENENDAEKYFSGAEIKYVTQFELALLRFGSYELIKSDEGIFKNFTPEQKENIFKSLDDRAENLQAALIDYCENYQDYLEYTDYAENFSIMYTNFIQNFAPQRLITYTSNEDNFEILYSMNKLRNLSMKNAEINEVANELIDFSYVYDLDDIMELIELHQKLQNESLSFDEKTDYIWKMDKILTRAVTAHGPMKGMMNFANVACVSTLNKLVDYIPYRINTFGVSKVEDLEEIDIVIRSAETLCSIFKSKEKYPINLVESSQLINKIFQLASLGILPEECQQKLDGFLDENLKRKELSVPDMSVYDEFIDNRREIPKELAEDFFDDVTVLVIKNGMMSAKYNEYLVAQLLDENSYFSKKLTDIQKNIVMENFARIKSDSLTGNKNYITYSNELYNRKDVTAGEHMPGFIKLMPKLSEDQIMNIVMNIVSTYHELRHEQQDQAIQSLNYSHLTYMMKKEQIIRSTDFGFYSKNYRYIYAELDAEYFALKNTIHFLETLNLSNFKQDTRYAPIMKVLEKHKRQIEEAFLSAKIKDGKNEEKFDVEEYIDEEVKKNPDILAKNPILKVEYNDDGTRKSIRQIFEDFTVICKEKNNRLGNYDLYKYVLLSRVGENMQECVEISDFEVPEDLSPATKSALNKLKYLIINRALDKMSGINKEIIPGKPIKDTLSDDELRMFEKATESMDDENRKKYNYIINDDNEERE